MTEGELANDGADIAVAFRQEMTERDEVKRRGLSFHATKVQKGTEH